MHPEPQADGSWTLHVNPNWPGFIGHFPGAALVPAGMVIDWALAIIGRDKNLERAKFSAPIFPGDQIVFIRAGFKIEVSCRSRTVAVLHFSDNVTPAAPIPLP